jgi:hypothetical protein
MTKIMCGNCGKPLVCAGCGVEVESTHIKRLCPRNVSSSDAENGICRHYLKTVAVKNPVAEDVEKWLSNVGRGVTFTKSMILNDLNLKDKTSGDDILKSLSFYVCIGRINRIQHNVVTTLPASKKGREHIYQKNEGEVFCEYLAMDDTSKKRPFKCKCPDAEFTQKLIPKCET